jgi:metal-responsive CopG/Arc/MetJ family transcriptional regulator
MRELREFLEYEKQRKRTSGNVTLPFGTSPEVRERLDKVARREGISRNAVLRCAVLFFLASYEDVMKKTEEVPCTTSSALKRKNRLFGVLP